MTVAMMMAVDATLSVVIIFTSRCYDGIRMVQVGGRVAPSDGGDALRCLWLGLEWLILSW